MKKMAVILIVMIATVSCDKECINCSFQGTWSGYYNTTGSFEQGNWYITITDRGHLSGTAQPLASTTQYTITGSVTSSGQLNATIGSVFDGEVISGKLSNSLASGTWSNTNTMLNGTWSGKKR